ncbi:MAG: hypothetical protein LBJ64_00095 [Deltaproteobacteria bacterium]|jgi:hypothetical protein|nr:hypothetical protein [Deltaproteobacteria bacterium]
MKPANHPHLGAAVLSTLLFVACLAAGCSSPSRFENSLIGPQAPASSLKKIFLSFENERSFAALANRQVTVSVAEPAALLSPKGGRAQTDAQGKLEVVVEPAAVYDRSALKSGDIVVDYPARVTISMMIGSDAYEWDIDCHDSFARYSDPLYRGLDRDPDPTPLHLTLTAP